MTKAIIIVSILDFRIIPPYFGSGKIPSAHYPTSSLTVNSSQASARGRNSINHGMNLQIGLYFAVG
jgi:hypothetical protein